MTQNDSNMIQNHLKMTYIINIQFRPLFLSKSASPVHNLKPIQSSVDSEGVGRYTHRERSVRAGRSCTQDGTVSMKSCCFSFEKCSWISVSDLKIYTSYGVGNGATLGSQRNLTWNRIKNGVCTVK